MATEKTCFKCGCVKPLDEFYAHPMMADGHLNKCKECTRRDVKENRAANINYYRDYDSQRASTPVRKALADRIQKQWRSAWPERRSAQNAVWAAIRSGLIKPLPCWVCGAKAQAHHPDYSSPLDVVWLCPAHHKEAHGIARSA